MLLVLSDASGKETSSGTGFVISNDGKLVTNYHVIEGATSAVAKSENGAIFVVEGVLATDEKNDLAVLKLRARDLPFLALADSTKLEPGRRVAVIGSPRGLEGTLSEGIVSALRDLPEEGQRIQITAAISPGSSGSPVLNEKGEVVGVATAILRGGQALNFAVPSTAAVKLLATASNKPLLFAQAARAGGERDEEFLRSDEYRVALAAESAENWVEMLKAAQALAARFPNRAATQGCLGKAYAQLGLLDDAVRALKQAIKIKPDYAEAWRNLGFAYGKQDRCSEAIAAYQEAIKLKPNLARTWTSLGTCYLRQSMPNDAIAALNQAIKLDPNDSSAWLALGGAYLTQINYSDAINALQQSVKLAPDSTESWFLLGLACWSSGHKPQAIDAIKQLRRLNAAKAAELEQIFSR
jgi:cytochrome c-type biogenesis protein CcmH/NrfG